VAAQPEDLDASIADPSMSSSPEDDDRTVVRGASSSFGDSRFVTSSSLLGHTLPEGTRLAEFEITGLIGEGGFGIVYLAWDPSLQRQVAVKEYMPSSLAARTSTGLGVAVRSPRHADTFQAGLKSFVNEARLLARFDHPSLVKVYRFWEDNGTAYMVMPYYDGPTLKHALGALGAPPDETQLKAWLWPLLDALAVIHKASCFHRDIAPDNILLTATGPLLLDFGAARRVIGDMTHALTVVLKPGYAPIEQYGESTAMAQGAWTDLYALCSVVYYAITGKPPMSSVERLMSDSHQPLAVLAAGRYSEDFLRAIDAGLVLRPQERPQDVAALRALLDPDGAATAALQHPGSYAWDGPYQTQPMPLHSRFDVPLTTPPPAIPTQPLQHPPTTSAPVTRPVATASPTPAMPRFDAPPAPPPTTAAIESGRPKSRALVVGGVGLAFALAAAGLLYVYSQRHPPEPLAPAPAPAVQAPVPGATSTAPAAAPLPVPSPAPASEAPAPIAPAPAAPPVIVHEVPAPAPAPVPAAAAPQKAPLPAAVEPPPAAVEAPRPSPKTTLNDSPKPARAPADARPPSVAPHADAPAPVSAAVRTKCSDILQKASLQALTPDEAAYLRRECR
jgi:serine/threonine protein kinase